MLKTRLKMPSTKLVIASADVFGWGEAPDPGGIVSFMNLFGLMKFFCPVKLTDAVKKSNTKPEMIKWMHGFLGVLKFLNFYAYEC
jgi:hypothetical protein